MHLFSNLNVSWTTLPHGVFSEFFVFSISFLLYFFYGFTELCQKLARRALFFNLRVLANALVDYTQ